VLAPKPRDLELELVDLAAQADCLDLKPALLGFQLIHSGGQRHELADSALAEVVELAHLSANPFGGGLALPQHLVRDLRRWFRCPLGPLRRRLALLAVLANGLGQLVNLSS